MLSKLSILSTEFPLITHEPICILSFVSSTVSSSTMFRNIYEKLVTKNQGEKELTIYSHHNLLDFPLLFWNHLAVLELFCPCTDNC